MATADIQVIWENSNDGCKYNKFHNLFLILSCFESCLVSTTDSSYSATNTAVNYVTDDDSDIPIEICSVYEETKIIRHNRKTDAWLKKLSKSNSRSRVSKAKYYNNKMKPYKKIPKKGNFRKK